MKRIFFTLLAVLFAARALYAQELVSQAPQQAPEADIGDIQGTEGAGEIAPVEGGMQGLISLDLRSIEVVDALKFLAMKAGINIVYTKNVSGRISLTVQDAVIQDVFDIMLRSNDLAYSMEGSIYSIMTEKEYKAIFGRKFSDIRQVKTFRLKYAIPEQAFSLIDTLKSDIGRVLVEPDSGTVAIMDTPDKIKEIEEALATLERKNDIKVFDLKYANAKDMEEKLKTQLDAKKVGSVKADDRSNQVIVQTLSDRMSDVQALIEALDKKAKQVLIDAKIVKVKLTDQLDQGIEWEGLVNAGQKLGYEYIGSTPFTAVQTTTDDWRSRSTVLSDMGNNVGSYPFSGFSTNFSGGSKKSPGEEIHIGTIAKKRDIDILIKYLQTLGDTRILSNPKIAVVNNQEAKIHIGEKQAYVTTTTTTGQTTTTVSEEVTFVDVGIQFAVTPTINDEGYITMKIKPEVSSVVSTLETPSGNKIPIIDTSLAETTVMVKDGATIVIGGLRKEENTKSSEQLPFLGKIPILGFLFKSSTDTKERTELLVMMTPHIVSGDELVTGDERDFGYKNVKEYKEYTPLTEGTDYEEAVAPPEARIKPYQEYSRIEGARGAAPKKEEE